MSEDTLYYKATQVDGYDFRTGRTIDYGRALGTGHAVVHDVSERMIRDRPATYLSVSVDPAGTLIGGSWPCRLFRVEPVGEVLGCLEASPHKRAVLAMRVVEELDAWRALGPNGQEVAQFIERLPEAMRPASSLAARAAARKAAWDAAWVAARAAVRDAALEAALEAVWDAAREAALEAARKAAWDAAWAAARDAAREAVLALVVKDLISEGDFKTLTSPWRILTGEEL